MLNPANGHYYELVNLESDLNWAAAAAAAAAASHLGLPGHLVTITSEAESQFIQANFAVPSDFSSPENFTWIGLFQPSGTTEPGAPVDGSAGGWQWVTGEPFYAGEAHDLPQLGRQRAEQLDGPHVRGGRRRAHAWHKRDGEALERHARGLRATLHRRVSVRARAADGRGDRRRGRGPDGRGGVAASAPPWASGSRQPATLDRCPRASCHRLCSRQGSRGCWPLPGAANHSPQVFLSTLRAS